MEAVDEAASAIRQWLSSEFGAVNHTTLDAMTESIQKQCFSNATHRDQLAALVSAVVGHVCNACDLTDTKLQPIKIAEVAERVVAKLRLVIEQLLQLIGDAESAIDIIIFNVQHSTTCSWPAAAPLKNKECVVVGVLLALKDIDEVAESLLGGCRRIEARGVAMEKFIDFLADEEDS